MGQQFEGLVCNVPEMYTGVKWCAFGLLKQVK